MKATKLIQKLARQIEEHGDTDVVFCGYNSLEEDVDFNILSVLPVTRSPHHVVIELYGEEGK